MDSLGPLGEHDKLSNLTSANRATRLAAVPMRCTIGKFENPRWLSYPTIDILIAGGGGATQRGTFASPFCSSSAVQPSFPISTQHMFLFTQHLRDLICIAKH